MALKKINIENASRFCALVIGPAGIGKTSLLRTILGQCYDQDQGWVQCQEPTGRVLTLSAESGLLCVRDLIAAGGVRQLDWIQARHLVRHCGTRRLLVQLQHGRTQRVSSPARAVPACPVPKTGNVDLRYSALPRQVAGRDRAAVKKNDELISYTFHTPRLPKGNIKSKWTYQN